MSFKLHSKGRRRISPQRHRVANWRDYDASLGNRRNVRIWFTPEAIADWKAQPRTTPGGQRHYSNLAIETTLTLRAAFATITKARASSHFGAPIPSSNLAVVRLDD